VASVVGKSFFLEDQGYECDMAGVHGLDGKTLGVDLDIDHLD
jgi:hypothetical protein